MQFVGVDADDGSILCVEGTQMIGILAIVWVDIVVELVPTVEGISHGVAFYPSLEERAICVAITCNRVRTILLNTTIHRTYTAKTQ